MREPYDYYRFGQEYVGPLLNFRWVPATILFLLFKHPHSPTITADAPLFRRLKMGT